MPTFVSLNQTLRNAPVLQQSTIDFAYEYTYWLPVISSSSSIKSVQNAAVANAGNVSVGWAVDSTNNVIMVAFILISIIPI